MNSDTEFRVKSLRDILNEDSSLMEKISIDEFNYNVATSDNSDESLEAAY